MRKKLITALAFALAAGALTDPATAQGAPTRNTASKPQQTPAVHGATLTPLALPADPAAKAAQKKAPRAVWPAAGTATVVVPGAGAATVSATATTAPTAASAPVEAGKLPVWISSAKDASAPASVRVAVLDPTSAQRAGVSGLLFSVRSADTATAKTTAAKSTAVTKATVSVDYSAFRGAYGGDWSQRLRLVQLPACALTTPEVAVCRRQTALASTNDTAVQRVSAAVPATASGDTVLAATAAPSGGTGDYTATSLSAAGSWAVSTQSGDFVWSYQMRVPQVPGGLTPEVTANYSSGAMDGQTATSNNQPSWVGAGWDLWPGYVERSYGSCSNDTAGGSPATGDLCWVTDNATVSLGGMTSQLVKDSGSGTWHLRDDNGSRVEHLTGAGNGAQNGEYWRITTTDGTQYYFGLNHLPGWGQSDPETQSTWTAPVFGNDAGEPCHGATFGASWCQQAWRWNLDHVVDPHGNTITYYYQPETNSYGLDMGVQTVSYIRGGTLVRAEYGTRQGQEYSAPAPARVEFTSAARCAPGTDCTQHTATSYPDVPWDQSCSSSCTTQNSPTFWSTQRLASVTAQIANSSGYQSVDTWTLDQTYPDPGDGTGAGLWLHGITHTGQVGGSVAMPEETFGGSTSPNRLNTANDGLPPMDKYRIASVDNGTGGTIKVTYEASDCSPTAPPVPDSNTHRCFPVYWTPAGAGPLTDWFAKTRVAQVVQTDRVGGNPSQVTTYQYGSDGGAWAYNANPIVPAARRTWDLWRGYDSVDVIQGDPSDTANPRSDTHYLYFRGMNGDHLADGSTRSAVLTDSQGGTWNDDVQLAGMTREEITYNGIGGAVVTDKIDSPWQYGPTAKDGTYSAYVVDVGESVTLTPLSAGGHRTAEVDTSYDNQGDPTQINDVADAANPAEDRCTTITYARNETEWLLTLPSRKTTVGVPCSGTATYPKDAISDVRTYYDGGAWGAAPTAGDATTVEKATDYQAGSPVWTKQSSTTYDAYGRALSVTDAMDRTTATAYTPATGLPTSSAVTDPLGDTTTTTLDPDWNLPTATVDANNRRTDMTYDALGRLTAVWKPGRSKAANQGPNVRYAYGITDGAPNWTSTSTLEPNANYVTGYTLYDGFLRPRQTQAPAEGGKGGRELTDTIYDSRGLVAVTTGAYFDPNNSAGTSVYSVGYDQIYNETFTVDDGAERPVASIFKSQNVEKWRTTTAYGGDHTDVTPPAGGTPTTTYVNGRGQTTELRQYLGATPAGSYRSTTYTYTPAGQQASVTDAAGNTTTYSYNVAGDLTGTVDPARGSLSATYDADGEKLTSTDGLNQTIAYSYDALGRKTAENQGSTSGTPLASWQYDTVPDGKGELASSSSYVNGNAYTQTVSGYNAADQPTGISVTIPSSEKGLAGTYTTNYSYLPDGSVSTASEPALGDLRAETLSYSYDDLGRPIGLSGTADYLSGLTYTPIYQPSTYTFGDSPSQVWLNLYYANDTGRLTESLAEREQGVTIADQVNYGYDASGNVTSIQDQTAGAATDLQCFVYDSLRELTQAWSTTDSQCSATPGSDAGGPAAYWQTYGYNTTGDRTSLIRHGIGGTGDTTVSYAYPAAGSKQPHNLRSTTTTGPSGTTTASYSYDAKGDTTGLPAPDGTNQTLTWNSEGDLASATSAAAGTETYVYDADGTLLISRSPAGATLELPSGEVHTDAAGTVTGTRLYQAADQSFAERTHAGVDYLISDRSGTADLEVDAGTLAAAKRRFDPFGNARGPGAAWVDDRGFVGGIQDAASGLTRLGARDYDPVTGRFVSADPIVDSGNPLQMEGYAYSDDNPTTLSDPSGAFVGFDDNEKGRIINRGEKGRTISWGEKGRRINRGSKGRTMSWSEKGRRISWGEKGRRINQGSKGAYRPYHPTFWQCPDGSCLAANLGGSVQRPNFWQCPDGNCPGLNLGGDVPPKLAPKMVYHGGPGPITTELCTQVTLQYFLSVSWETCGSDNYLMLGVGLGEGASISSGAETTTSGNSPVQGYANVGDCVDLVCGGISGGRGLDGSGWVEASGGIGIGDTDSVGIDIPAGSDNPHSGPPPARSAIDYAH